MVDSTKIRGRLALFSIFCTEQRLKFTQNSAKRRLIAVAFFLLLLRSICVLKKGLCLRSCDTTTFLISACLLLWSCSSQSDTHASTTLASEKKSSSTEELDFQTGCISKHLREAIQLNESRAPLYGEVSGGRSRHISYLLITLERLTLTTLRPIETAAEEYQKRGIPLLCLDVVPMTGARGFSERTLKPTDSYQPFDSISTSIELSGSILPGSDSTLEATLLRSLSILNKNTHYNCFSRHIIESLLRSVRLKPYYRRLSLEKGLRDPAPIIRTYVSSQIAALPAASLLDSQSAELNAQGIPIICNVVPNIETEIEKILR